MPGGEESAAWRLGGFVIRVGPAWRTAAEAEWSYAVAAAVSAQVPEVVAALESADGATVQVIGGRPCSVWPFIAGKAADRADPAQRAAAAELLARLHAALAGAVLGERPAPAVPLGDGTDLADLSLDAWLARFGRAHPARQALHGDYYPGNVLAEGGQLAAVLDWDEASTGPPESELAAAAWEWGDGLRSGRLGGALEFVRGYRQAGGPAGALGETALRQLIRQRLRWEIRYKRSQCRQATRTPEDGAYTAAQFTAYHDLRPAGPCDW